MKTTIRKLTCGVALALPVLAAALCHDAHAAEKPVPPKLIITVDTFDSEYWSDFINGAKDIARSVNETPVIIASDYDGQKLISQFSALVAGGCEHCAVVTAPTSIAFLKPMVDRAASAGAQLVSVWTRPETLHPWDTRPDTWAVHTTFDGVRGGYENGQQLCKALNGHGNVAAIEGVPDNTPAKQRLAGLKKALAECPGVKLLDVQVGAWEQAKAHDIASTWLAKYGNQLNGIFAENDAMALGVVAALRERGLAGKVAVTGSDGTTDVLKLIKSGEILSTTLVDPQLQGAVSTAFAYAAASGDIDLKTLSNAQRDFYLEETLVTRDNVDKVLAKKLNPPKYTYQELSKNLWRYSSGPIPAGANL